MASMDFEGSTRRKAEAARAAREREIAAATGLPGATRARANTAARMAQMFGEQRAAEMDALLTKELSRPGTLRMLNLNNASVDRLADSARTKVLDDVYNAIVRAESTLGKLEIANAGLPDSFAERLAGHLAGNPPITHLNLEGNRFTSAGITALAPALAKCTRLKSLRIDRQNHSCSPEAKDALLEAIEDSVSITTCAYDFERPDLNQRRDRALAASLDRARLVRKQSGAAPSARDRAMSQFAMSPIERFMTEVRASGARSTDQVKFDADAGLRFMPKGKSDGICADLAQFVVQFGYSKIDLVNAGVHDSFLVALAAACASRTAAGEPVLIEELILERSQIHDAGITALAGLLPSLTHLRTVNLKAQPKAHSHAARTALLEGLQQCPSVLKFFYDFGERRANDTKDKALRQNNTRWRQERQAAAKKLAG